jgi:hypothetical protein
VTDCRLPERWLNDRRLQRLSAEHYRTYMNALMYAVANRTDGHIEPADVALIPHWSAHAAKAFIDAGLFAPLNNGWFIIDYPATQTSRSELETLEKIRARDRAKKARKRAEDKNTAEEVPGDSPGGDSPGTAQEGRQAGRKASKGSGVPEVDSASDSGLFVVNGGKSSSSNFLEHH